MRHLAGKTSTRDASKRVARAKATGDVTCAMCRAVWQGDQETLASVQMDSGLLNEGYVNVASTGHQHNEECRNNLPALPVWSHD